MPEISPDWTAALDAWTEQQATDGRSWSTIATRRKRVTAFAAETGTTDPWSVVLDDLTHWIATRSDVAPTTTYGYRQALRTFYAWAEKAGRVTTSPALYLDGANGGRPARRRVPRPVGRFGPLPRWTPGSWEGPLSAWGREQRARGLSPRSTQVWAAHLRRLARAYPHLGPFDLTLYDLTDYLSQHRWAAETRRAARSAFRSFYSWAAAEGHVEDSPAERLPSVRTKAPAPRPAPEMAVTLAVAAAMPRERLMVRLAAELGMRCREVAQVHSRDLVQHDDGWSLIVHGKGGKDRVVPLHDALTAELRLLPAGWAFPSPAGGHLTANRVGVLVRRLLPSGVTMHQLRHRFATRVYALTQDVLTVQQLLGHSRPETTQRYVEVGDDRLRAAVVTLARTTTRGA